MTDYKDIIQMVKAGIDPVELSENIELERPQTFMDYPALTCWLKRTYADPGRYVKLDEADIRRELTAIADRIEHEYDCGSVIAAETHSWMDYVSFGEIAGYCRLVAETLLKMRDRR